MNMRLWLGIGAVSTLLVLGAWRDVAQSERRRDVDLEEAVVSLGSVAKRVTLAGMLWPQKRATVWPMAPGRINRVMVSRGEAVRQGQPLAALDPWNAELEVERRRLALQRSQLRVNELPRSTNPPGAGYLTAELIDLKQNQLELKNAERTLANTILRAPMSGIVIHVGVREGDVVASVGTSAPPFIVADTSRFIVEVEGDEFEVASVTAGSRATVFAESSRQTPMLGYVQDNPILKRLAQGVSQGSVFGFSVNIETTSTALQLGMVATVEIEIERRDNVPIIPLAAVNREGDVDVVYVRTEGRLRRIPITMGLSDLFVVELKSGPKTSSTVVYGAPGAVRSIAGDPKN